MLKDFRQKLCKLSLGKRKFLLDKLNTGASQNDEDIRQHFIYVASLLLDEKKGLKETVSLSQNRFSVTSAQYEHYSLILEEFNSLTSIARKRFCSSVMKGKIPQKTLAISFKMRQDTKH